MSKTPQVRKRGRPRIPTPFDWLRDTPSWIHNDSDATSNLNDPEWIAERKAISEEYRRLKVSESVTEALVNDGNVANRIRADDAAYRLQEFERLHRSILQNPQLSARSAAMHIYKLHKNSCPAFRTVYAYVRKIRKMYAAK